MRRSINNSKAPAVAKWLRRRMLHEALINAGVAALSFLLGLAVLAFTFWGVCIFAFLVYPDKREFASWLYDGTASRQMPTVLTIVMAGLVVILMFVGNAMNRQKPSDELPLGRGAKAQRNPESSAFIMGSGIADLLYIGPRMLIASVGLLKQAFRQDQLEVDACAEILAVLLSRNSRFSFTELTGQTNLANSLRIYPQLREIEGVVFLKSDPPGLSLTAELREELFNIWRDEPLEATAASAEEPTAALAPDSPYVLLGITEKADLAEIKAAYRRRIKECHPDKFAALGSEWRVLAEERAKQLNAAYEALLAGLEANLKGN
jgi:hypothetical protein